jgi:hypothetical protein
MTGRRPSWGEGCPSEAQLALARDRGCGSEEFAVEVQAHLSSCARCRRRMDEIETIDATVRRAASLIERVGRAAGDEATEQPLASGFGLDGYDLHEEVDRGGQAVVHRATHRRSQRTVALKVMRIDSVRNRVRIEREARLVARLHHPNIVALYDCGDLRDGRFGIAMEWVDGMPFDRWADRVRRDASLGPAEKKSLLLSAFRGLCEAVEHAHRNGVIHRDLKPSNVLVDASGRPRLLDLGVAIEEGTSGGDRVTMTGEVACTIAYAAPEQLTVGAAPADTRTDVYALGLLLVELVAGRHPHEDAEGTGIAERIERTLHRDAPPLSTLLDGDAPFRGDSDLDTIVAKALARDPDRRYPSAAALRIDLERFERGEPIDARRDSFAYLARMTLRRHRTGVVVGAALAAAFVVGGAAVARAVIVEREAAARDAVQRGLLKAQSSRANAVTDVLRQVVPAEDTATFGRDAGQANRAIVAISDGLEGGLLADDPFALVATRTAIGDVSADRGGLRRAEVEYRQALRIARDLDDGSGVFKAVAMVRLAGLLVRRSGIDEAAHLVAEALPLLEAALGPDDAATLEAVLVQAEITATKGDSEAADRLLASVERRRARTDLRLAVRAADVALRVAATDDARRDRALALMRAEFLAFADGDERMLTGLDACARFANAPIRDDAAAVADAMRSTGLAGADPALHARLLDLKAALLGDDHRDLVETITRIGYLLADRGKRVEASQVVERAIAIAMPDGRAKTVGDAELLFSRLLWRVAGGPYEGARGDLDVVVEDSRRLLADRDLVHFLVRLRQISYCAAQLKEFALARALMQEAMDLAAERLATSPHRAWTLVEAGQAEVYMDDPARGLPLVRAGMADLDRADASWNWHKIVARLREAQLLAALSRTEESLAAIGRARALAAELPMTTKEQASAAAQIDLHEQDVRTGAPPR